MPSTRGWGSHAYCMPVAPRLIGIAEPRSGRYVFSDRFSSAALKVLSRVLAVWSCSTHSSLWIGTSTRAATERYSTPAFSLFKLHLLNGRHEAVSDCRADATGLGFDRL